MFTQKKTQNNINHLHQTILFWLLVTRHFSSFFIREGVTDRVDLTGPFWQHAKYDSRRNNRITVHVPISSATVEDVIWVKNSRTCCAGCSHNDAIKVDVSRWGGKKQFLVSLLSCRSAVSRAVGADHQSFFGEEISDILGVVNTLDDLIPERLRRRLWAVCVDWRP